MTEPWTSINSPQHAINNTEEQPVEKSSSKQQSDKIALLQKREEIIELDEYPPLSQTSLSNIFWENILETEQLEDPESILIPLDPNIAQLVDRLFDEEWVDPQIDLPDLR